MTTTTRKRYGRLIDERNKKIAKTTDNEATVENHIQRIRKALNVMVKQVEEDITDIDTDTTKGGS